MLFLACNSENRFHISIFTQLLLSISLLSNKFATGRRCVQVYCKSAKERGRISAATWAKLQLTLYMQLEELEIWNITANNMYNAMMFVLDDVDLLIMVTLTCSRNEDCVLLKCEMRFDIGRDPIEWERERTQRVRERFQFYNNISMSINWTVISLYCWIRLLIEKSCELSIFDNWNA